VYVRPGGGADRFKPRPPLVAQTAPMTVSFTLTPRQRDLRARARLATRPTYVRLVADGFPRACIPTSTGGDNESQIDTAVVVEELFAENAGIALTLLGTALAAARSSAPRRRSG
jgi:alkylation response protein AidB-like acyl-CoA dehydrogenase